MCEFKNDFLLCTCGDNLNVSDIDWKLSRVHNKSKFSLVEWKNNNSTSIRQVKTIGQINIPKFYAKMTPEEINEYENTLNSLSDKLFELIEMREKLKSKKETEYKNMSVNIQLFLNNKECFDKLMEFEEFDILSIRIDKDLDVWMNYIYKNSFWHISELFINKETHNEILDGKIKPTHNNV